MDILNNVQKAVKDTIKTLENAGVGDNTTITLSKFLTHQSRPPSRLKHQNVMSNKMKITKNPLTLARHSSNKTSMLAGSWKPAEVRGAIYRNKIVHFKDPIPTSGTLRTARTNEWVLNHFFQTGEAICRFCFKMANGSNGLVFVIINDRIRQNYTELTSLKMTPDGLPELLCPDCDANLSSAVETKRKIVEAEQKLLEFTKKIKLNEITSNTIINQNLSNVKKPTEIPLISPLKIKREESTTEITLKDFFKEQDEPMDLHISSSVLEPALKIKEDGDDNEIEDNQSFNDESSAEESNEFFSDISLMEGYAVTPEEDGSLKYLCTMCNVSFDREDLQRDHFLNAWAHKASNIKTFPCVDCTLVLSTAGSLNRHRLITHSDNLPCEYCDEACNKSTVDKHMNEKHPDKSFNCDLCQEPYKSFDLITAHITTNHAFDKSYRCGHCGISFEEKIYRRIHINQLHKIKSDWACLHCGLKCYSKAALKDHLAICVKILEQETGVTIKMDSKACEYCQETFMNRNDLANHKLRMHTSKYDCPLCASKFTIKKKFEAHVKRHKDVPRPYKCDQCDASYGKPAHLQSHIIRTHTKNFKYHCQYCLKGFIQVGEKVAHERTHTGEKPVGCHLCEKRFTRQEQLRRHIKRTHCKRKRYKCQWCDRDLSDSRKLFDHVNKFHADAYNSDVDLDSWAYEVEPDFPDTELHIHDHHQPNLEPKHSQKERHTDSSPSTSSTPTSASIEANCSTADAV